jgi:hypothetical protein
MEEERKVYKVLMGKPEGKRPFGRPRRRWKDGVRMCLRDTGRGSVGWIHVAHHRDRWWAVVNTVIISGFWLRGVSYGAMNAVITA